MKISLQEIEVLGAVSRIAFQSKGEKEQLQRELDEMIAHAQAVQAPLCEFPPLQTDREQTTVWREDEVCASLPRESLLKNAPVTDGDYIAVPRTVET